jgi:hypothetical protein
MIRFCFLKIMLLEYMDYLFFNVKISDKLIFATKSLNNFESFLVYGK